MLITAIHSNYSHYAN